MINIKEIVAGVISLMVTASFCVSIFVAPATFTVTLPLFTGVLGFYLRPTSTLVAGSIAKYKNK